MREKIGGVHEQYGPVHHRAWENMTVGDLVGVEGQDGLYRIKRILFKEGIAEQGGKAEVVEVDKDNEDFGKVFRVDLKSLTKDIA